MGLKAFRVAFFSDVSSDIVSPYKVYLENNLCRAHVSFFSFQGIISLFLLPDVTW